MRTSAASVPKQKDIHTHLFGRVQRLGHSASVTEYLLFNMPIPKQPQNAPVELKTITGRARLIRTRLIRSST